MSVSKLSFRKKIALKIFTKFRSNEIKLHQLNCILWETTLRCNLSCLHCGSDCKKDSAVKDMPAKDFFKALDQVRGIINPRKTMIVLTGGEALLRKDIEAIGHELYKREHPWGIVSNGLMLNQQKLDALLKAGLRSITVSLDGMEESHNWLRGNKKSFEKASEAIKLLPKVSDLEYDVVTCVNRRNIHELLAIKDFLITNKVKAWRIFTIFPIGRAAEIDDFQLHPKEFKLVFDFIKQTRKEGEIKLSYGCEGFLGNYEAEVRDDLFMCRSGINIASILADGSITGCPNLRENFIQGNIYNDNFAQVWQTKYQTYRDRSWTKTGICAHCDSFAFCQGNGMHLRNEKTGDLLFCHLKRLEEAET